MQPPICCGNMPTSAFCRWRRGVVNIQPFAGRVWAHETSSTRSRENARERFRVMRQPSTTKLSCSRGHGFRRPPDSPTWRLGCHTNTQAGQMSRRGLSRPRRDAGRRAGRSRAPSPAAGYGTALMVMSAPRLPRSSDVILYELLCIAMQLDQSRSTENKQEAPGSDGGERLAAAHDGRHR
jgi:hypothetical protein